MNSSGYQIRNADLSAEVTKTGIELCSLKSLHSGTEYIWQADPEIWGSHAPVLFPIIGGLKEGLTFFEGKACSIPKHGMVRHSDKPELIEQTGNELLFRMIWDEETLKIYPFKFEFLTRYTLKGTSMIIRHEVINRGEGPMYFSLGGHPAFNCPVHPEASYEDHYLKFEHQETVSTWLLDDNGLVSDQTELILDDTDILPLHDHLFDRDALIFKDLRSRSVELVHKDHGAILSMNYEGFPYLGIWAKPGAPFVCIEPWLGIADSADTDQQLVHKEGILKLNAGKSYKTAYSVNIHQ